MYVKGQKRRTSLRWDIVAMGQSRNIQTAAKFAWRLLKAIGNIAAVRWT
jgi:hypothetical protein